MAKLSVEEQEKAVLSFLSSDCHSEILNKLNQFILFFVFSKDLKTDFVSDDGQVERKRVLV